MDMETLTSTGSMSYIWRCVLVSQQRLNVNALEGRVNLFAVSRLATANSPE